MGERCLWLAVLGENLNLVLRGRDMLGKADSGRDVRAAESWVGTADFRHVCDLAGLNADFVLRWINEQRALPLAERHAEMVQLRHISSAMHQVREVRHGAAG